MLDRCELLSGFFNFADQFPKVLMVSFLRVRLEYIDFMQKFCSCTLGPRPWKEILVFWFPNPHCFESETPMFVFSRGVEASLEWDIGRFLLPAGGVQRPPWIPTPIQECCRTCQVSPGCELLMPDVWQSIDCTMKTQTKQRDVLKKLLKSIVLFHVTGSTHNFSFWEERALKSPKHGKVRNYTGKALWILPLLMWDGLSIDAGKVPYR